MSRNKENENWSVNGALGACVCSQLRRTARRVSGFYDAALAGVGLTVTQHALLVNIGRTGAISRHALAAQVGMDRTTLTRNLKPLEAARLVVPAASQDARERLLRVSPAGRRKLRQSYESWAKAQQQLIAVLGPEILVDLRRVLTAAESAAETASAQKNGLTLRQ